MSYYNIQPHHIFGHRATRSPSPSPYTPLDHPTPHHHRATPTSSPFAGMGYDLDEEERATLAHLRHLQQRREAQQASIQREAAIRLRAQEEREAAIRRAVAEKRRELAIAKAIEQQREQAIAEAVAREKERIRAAIIEEHHRRQQEEEDRHRQLVAQHRERLVQHRQQQQRAAQIAAINQARQQQIDQAIASKVECAKRCAGRYAQRAGQHAVKEVKKEYKEEYEAINNLLAGLFGISLADVEEKKEVATEPKSTPTPTPAPAPAGTQTPAPAATPAPSTAPEQTGNAFPEHVNELLSHVLGLRVEPTTEPSPKLTSVPSTGNAVPQGLNEFLSRFGLVFEPESLDSEKEAQAAPTAPAPAPFTAAEPKKVEVAPTSVADPPEPTLPSLVLPSTSAPAVASSSQPQARPSTDEHPLTTFLNGMADMPPFVRDILGNVEMAFKEEQHRSEQGQKEEAVNCKGKAVAEGEKKAPAVVTAPVVAPVPVESTPSPTPAPVPTTTAAPEVDNTASALSTLSTISSDLSLVRDSFDFPSTLSFASPSSTDPSPPALLFNKANSGYHAQTHKLLQLLLAADAINSQGNKEVRRRRKEVVREVEREIEGLEKRRDEVWEEVKAARERGETEHLEHHSASSSSCGSSVADPSEVREHEEEVKGFEVPAESTPTVPEPEPTSAPVDTASVPAPNSEVEEKKVDPRAARVDKEDEFELV
ncbi:uncharacterized protein MKK02DRAFT_33266 [Dioszegia hungarica]|uniref:BAG domain-containing protein n=1 Tax=Dioszegia hungarica TaxID=4972 RepID=A0AA38H816_9TREE|nr:uncharacterized protein MKK02DRAFT_33266 [Dioszegia hungarica]KAI9635963.1 hypothetical protein MKK02DRAFT_33266 [Dioszegia hungarica]